MTLTATLTGGTFSTATIRYEVKKPGRRSYRLLKTVKLSSTGVATYKCKVTAQGHLVLSGFKFLGDATYLPSPLRPASRSSSNKAFTTRTTCDLYERFKPQKGTKLWLSRRMKG